MTEARIGEVFIEALSEDDTRARAGEVFIEVLTQDDTRARVGEVFIEVIVGAPLGWTVGVIEF